MSSTGKKRRFPTASSPNQSDDDSGEPSSSSTSQVGNKRRGSVAADFAAHRLIVSERQQMAVLKQLTAGEESNAGSQSPSSVPTQTRPSKIHRRNEHGETIVHIAARKGDIKQLKKVLKAGANVNEADNAGWTPLHEAVTKNQFKTARLLLKSGANVNAPGPEGQTPLVDAVLNNNAKMAELLLRCSADPSVVDINRLSETMAKVLKGELSVLEASENENNDEESNSSLSPLTSDDGEHDDEKTDEKQCLNVEGNESNEKALSPRHGSSSTQRKKPYRRFRERSSHSSDSSSQSKTRTVSGNNEVNASVLAANKNPYDFESEEEGEIRESTAEIHDEQPLGKKKNGKKQDQTKQRTQSGNSGTTGEISQTKKRSQPTNEPKKDQDYQKSKLNIEDEQVQHIHRIPPLKIVLARAVLQRTTDLESPMTSNIDENSSSSTDPPSLSISIPTNESDEKPLSSNVNNLYPDADDKAMNPDDEQTQHSHPESNQSPVEDVLQQAKPIESIREIADTDNSSNNDPYRNVISSLLDQIINQISETLENSSSSSVPTEEEPTYMDDEVEVEDEEMDDDEDDLESSEANNQSTKLMKIQEERNNDSTSSTTNNHESNLSLQKDLKPTTRTLRSHARGKISSSSLIQSSSSHTNHSHGRRVSSRRRQLENKSLIIANDRERRRRVASDRLRKDKDNNPTTNDELQTSSNSDDQNQDNSSQLDKIHGLSNNPNDDASSCSSLGAGEGSSTSSSTVATKQSANDVESLPPNKRRLRDRNTALTSTNNESSNTTQTTNDPNPIDSSPVREVPINSIKQFLEIRHQIDKRHETMLTEFVLPKVPKDFSETTMAKKSYLISSANGRHSMNSPASMGIRRLDPPSDLDAHLAEVFTKQEDERYRLKLRHQVERDKLILSHEQEVLRLYGNATRSSLNQETPFSYCSLLKDQEVYNNPAAQLSEKERAVGMFSTDFPNTELGKRGKHRWNGRSFLKWLEDSNIKYKRLSCELNERQRLEVETLYSMQRMVWSKHLPKESLNLSLSGRSNNFLTEKYLPKVEINPNFWTDWEPSPF